MSGRPSAGVQSGWPPSVRLVVRASASAKRGLWGPVSAAPLRYRLTVSTPAAMKMSPSPAWMAWAAMRMVCSEEEQ